MRILTNSRYATRMLLDIAQHQRGRPVLMKDVAARLDLSQKYLEKLSRPLKEAGLLLSQRGPAGGHFLGRAPGEISVGDVVRVMEGGAELVGCDRDEAACLHAPGCLTRMIWKECSKAIFTRLDALTFEELLRYADHEVKFGDFCTTVEAQLGHKCKHAQSVEQEPMRLAAAGR